MMHIIRFSIAASLLAGSRYDDGCSIRLAPLMGDFHARRISVLTAIGLIFVITAKKYAYRELTETEKSLGEYG